MVQQLRALQLLEGIHIMTGGNRLSSKYSYMYHFNNLKFIFYLIVLVGRLIKMIKVYRISQLQYVVENVI